ncbi:hypothetical protein B0A55_08326 [Friedmanniomyces simplex]|uniref:Uncharacterized protein n=1 Tax=Friedmanniomyces simplex TaxID=329884 RepID=A0A4U0X8G5_9PEZI|nr:hypothetical protein B0A55_08326 [Friedmanniomyces simplex]
MFAKVRNRHERRGSSTSAVPTPLNNIPAPTNTTIPPPLVSPLQMTFDFELHPPNTLSAEPFRPSSDSFSRPQTSDGLGLGAAGNRKSTIGLQPPVLPPIPRIASRHGSIASSLSQPSEAGGAGSGLGARHESDNISALSAGSRKSTGIRLMPSRSFEHPIDSLPTSRSFEHYPVELLPTSGPLGAPTGLGLEDSRSTFGESASTTPRMQASIFPTRPESQNPVLPAVNGGPAMTREFIDSRDKPYSHPSARGSSTSQPAMARPAPMQNSQSMPFLSTLSSPVVPSPHSPASNASFNRAMSPNVLSVQASSPMLPSLQTPSSFSSFHSQSPVSPHMPTPSSATSMSLRAPKISGARLSPNSSVEDLRLLQRSSTNGTTITRTYTLSDAPMDDSPLTAPAKSGKPGARTGAHGNKAHSPSAHSPLATIGTPYQENSPSFPLPQHVSVRPKTSGGVSTIAGVSVPTHHTSAGQRPESASSTAKPEKRKTRLLNPMALLSRRKSSQESEEAIAERSAAAQAYARQRSVAALGVNKMPADFDPRIKGNKVHDFSAPRQPRRNFSYNDADNYSPDAHLQSANSTPSVPFLQYDPHFEQPPSRHSKHTSDSSSVRKSVHSPMFRELLTEDPDTAKRVSSLNAERLENKDFLQRVSHHSSNSGFSQESSVLPPFARRSQVLDPMQASLANEEESTKRASDPSSSSGRGRESKTSSVGEVSPITARSSTQQVELRQSPNQSLSPVSPNTPDKTFRPISAVSDLPPPMARMAMPLQSAPTSPERRGRTTSEATARTFSTVLATPPGRDSTNPGNPPPPLPVQRARSPYRNSAEAPEAVMVPNRTSSLTPETLRLPLPLPGRTSDLPTPELTPEIGTANPVHFPAKLAVVQAPRLVEKRASAVGHARRTPSSSGTAGGVVVGAARHRVSNASRFSFQFDEGREEERALEEKHRMIKGGSGGFRGGDGDGEEEEEEFDEGAMDDMDELEVREQEQEEEEEVGRGIGVGGVSTTAGKSLLSMQNARQQLQHADDSDDDDDDDGSVYEDEDEEGGKDELPSLTTDERRLRHLTWAEHPAMRAHSALASHSRSASQATYDNGNGNYNFHYEGQQEGEGGGYMELQQQQQSQSIQQQQYQQQSQQQPQQQYQQQGHNRNPSTTSALTLDTTNIHTTGDPSAAFVQDAFSTRSSMPGGVGGARPRSGFYMLPKAAGYSPHAGSPLAEGRPLVEGRPTPPVLPHRDSGSSERNRVGSGMSFGAGAGASAGAGAVFGGSAGGGQARTVSGGPRLPEARAESSFSGLGLSGFGDFQFGEGPDMTLSASRPTSYETWDIGGQNVKMMDGNGNRNWNRGFRDSETIPRSSAGWAEMREGGGGGTPLSNGRATSSYFSSPEEGRRNGGARIQSAAYRGSIGNGLRQRNERGDRNRQYADSDLEEDDGDNGQDDMYFDDGGFEQDIRHTTRERSGGSGVDEEDFDDPAFLGGANRVNGQMGHQRQTSAAPVFPSLGGGGGGGGGDGPYPSFAMGANPLKSRVRQSQMLLEDLPLIGPVDPKLIPQRNPSEDAKRLGLSNKVPPLPPQPGPGSAEAMAQMQVRMQAYHASLAEALNKAAAEGRFARQLSIASTARTGSVRSAGLMVDEDVSRDDRSYYSRDESGAADGSGLAVPPNGRSNSNGDGDGGLNRSISNLTSGSKMAHSLTYTPPKMSFDFGFEDLLTNDNPTDRLDADYGDDDDDIVAAANAEALASDDSGFYGQEFGFYANARPESGDMTAVNGGFFGEDGGDDGLSRSKSWKEPNMTPISERTEFSTRNSFINLGGHGAAMFGPPSAGAGAGAGGGPYGPASPALARLPRSPLAEQGGDVVSFEQLRRLRADAWGGSNGSLQGELGPAGGKGAGVKSATAAQGGGYFGAYGGGSPMTMGYSTDSSGSNTNSAGAAGGSHGYGQGQGQSQAQYESSPPPPQQQQQRYGLRESPHSATATGAPGAASGPFHFAPRDENEMQTPRKGAQGQGQQLQGAGAPVPEPVTARKMPPSAAPAPAHSRKGSDSVTYVREQDPAGGGQPRWVLERRRTSELGRLELVGREVVQGGWI